MIYTVVSTTWSQNSRIENEEILYKGMIGKLDHVIANTFALIVAIFLLASLLVLWERKKMNELLVRKLKKPDDEFFQQKKPT